MRFVDEIYQSDAYHSLSIEGYSVSAELIERVRAGNWDPDHHDADRQSRDALAARGYWQAFQVVKGMSARSSAEPIPDSLSAQRTGTGTGIVPALRRGGSYSGGRTRRLPERRGLLAHVALCAAALGGRARRHARVLRSAGAGTVLAHGRSKRAGIASRTASHRGGT